MCDEGWDVDDATVICRQLEFNEFGKSIMTINNYILTTILFLSLEGATPLSSAPFGQGTDLVIAMANVGCTSSESSLSDCPYNDANAIGSCSHSQDAGVRCLPRKHKEGGYFSMYIVVLCLMPHVLPPQLSLVLQQLQALIVSQQLSLSPGPHHRIMNLR